MSNRRTRQANFHQTYIQIIPILSLVMTLAIGGSMLAQLRPGQGATTEPTAAGTAVSVEAAAARPPFTVDMEPAGDTRDTQPATKANEVKNSLTASAYPSTDDRVEVDELLRQRRALRDVLRAAPASTPTETEPVLDTSGAAKLTTALLDPVGRVWQTLNNCGPASVSMVLAYYGHAVSQEEARAVLRPDPDEWGMLPNVVSPYVADFGLQARVLDHGTLDDIRSLVGQGVPVIVLQWLTEAEPIPHYRVVVGYDDAEEAFIVNDSVLGFGKRIPYADFEALWDVYTNLYMPVFREEDTSHVQALLGSQWERTVTFVRLAKSRPAWDALLAAGGPGAAAQTEEPTPEEVEASAEATAELVEATATPAPNTRAETAWSLVQGTTETGTLDGASAGNFAFYTVQVKGTGMTLEFKYMPDDGVIASGVGVKVYSAAGKLVSEGVNTTGQVGERTVNLPETPGHYLVQVYNYLPTVRIEFSLMEK